MRSNVVDDIFKEIMNRIASGEWTVGQKIPSESELTEMLQVSRNSLRQALNRFTALGIIESRHGDGSYVKSVDLSFYLNIIFPMVVLSHYDALNVYQIQRAIQNEAAHIVCKLASQEQREELMEYANEMKRCAQRNDKDCFLKADMRYHVLFTEMTRNPVLISIEQCISNILEGPLRDVVNHSLQNESIMFHMNIARALLADDEYSVVSWMSAHMEDVVQKLNQLAP